MPYARKYHKRVTISLIDRKGSVSVDSPDWWWKDVCQSEICLASCRPAQDGQNYLCAAIHYYY